MIVGVRFGVYRSCQGFNQGLCCGVGGGALGDSCGVGVWMLSCGVFPIYGGWLWVWGV